MNTIAFIPARANSKRLPKKNIKKLNGVSLIEHSVRFAKSLKFVDDIIISTDDKKIIKLYKKSKFIKLFKRPKHLATNNSETISVITHTLKKYEKKFNRTDTVILLQPTSPFRSNKIVHLAYDIYKKLKKTKSVISVSKSNNSLKRNFYIKNKYLEVVGKKNKKHKNIYQVNGNFYIGNKNFLNKYKSFYYTKKTIPIILKSKSLSIDIDTKEDFDKARRTIKKWAQK